MTTAANSTRDQRRAERQARFRLGHWAEWVAAVSLTLRGYRILARRCKNHCGEIDLIAVRGSTLAFVEVKARATMEDAQASISRKQAARTRRAASLWLSHRTRYHRYEQRFDAVYVVAGWWPYHVPAGA